MALLHHDAAPPYIPCLPAPPIALQLSPPPPDPWRPSARLIAGLGDAGLLGDWPSLDEVDLAAWRPHPRQPLKKATSSAPQ